MSERKYRQPGYQDTEPTSRSSPKREPKEGLTGRGLGAPDTDVFRCRDCGQKIDPHANLSLSALCSKCGAALHSCVNCSRFDTAAQFECTQPIPERLPSKTKANDCELFRPKIAVERREEPRPTAGRAAFDALFDR
jgi:hypothetical protein